MMERIESSWMITCKMNDDAVRVIMSSFDNDAYLYSDNEIMYCDAKSWILFVRNIFTFVSLDCLLYRINNVNLYFIAIALNIDRPSFIIVIYKTSYKYTNNFGYIEYSITNDVHQSMALYLIMPLASSLTHQWSIFVIYHRTSEHTSERYIRYL